MVSQLEEAIWQSPADRAESLDALNNMMNSPQLRQAMSMASRMPMMRSQNGGLVASTLRKTAAPPSPEDVADIDPELRTVLLKLQPTIREDLLQGMREEGPESYRRFIRNYFKELTRVKGGP